GVAVVGAASRTGSAGIVDGIDRVAFLRNDVVIVIRVKLESQCPLPAIVQAFDRACFFLGAGESRQQHRRKNGNDGDDDKQFDQGEGLGGAWSLIPVFFLNRHISTYL